MVVELFTRFTLIFFFLFIYFFLNRISTSTSKFDTCEFSNCNALGKGGAIYNTFSSSSIPSFKLCRFISNSAPVGKDIFFSTSLTINSWDDKFNDTCTNCDLTSNNCFFGNSNNFGSLFDVCIDDGDDEEEEINCQGLGDCGSDARCAVISGICTNNVCLVQTEGDCSYPCVESIDGCVVDGCAKYSSQMCLSQTNDYCKLLSQQCVSDDFENNHCKAYGFNTAQCEADDYCVWDTSITYSVLKCKSVITKSSCYQSETVKECGVAGGGVGNCAWNGSSGSVVKCRPMGTSGSCSYSGKSEAWSSSSCNANTNCKWDESSYEGNGSCENVIKHNECYQSETVKECGVAGGGVGNCVWNNGNSLCLERDVESTDNNNKESSKSESGKNSNSLLEN
jgi:hypothetical protein